jgi:hypothetical protein
MPREHSLECHREEPLTGMSRAYSSKENRSQFLLLPTLPGTVIDTESEKVWLMRRCGKGRSTYDKAWAQASGKGLCSGKG